MSRSREGRRSPPPRPSTWPATTATSTSSPTAAPITPWTCIRYAGLTTGSSILLISADHYADTLTYKVKDETGTGTHPVKLDTQQLLVGAGAMSLLEKAPKQLVFNNGGAADATVQILVGRSA